MGTMVYDVFKSQMHNFDGPLTKLQTEHRTQLQAWFNTYDVGFPTSRRRLGGGVIPRMHSNFICSSMGRIYIYTPIYCANDFESWSLDEANPTVQRWQIRALLAIGYHLHSTRFCHMYNLVDSMVELKHNAQTSKHKHFSFLLEYSVSYLIIFCSKNERMIDSIVTCHGDYINLFQVACRV